MSTNQETPKIPLPKGWKQHVRSAILNVISLAQYATVSGASQRELGQADHGQDGRFDPVSFPRTPSGDCTNRQDTRRIG